MSSCFYSTLVLFLSIVGTVSSLQKLPPNVTVPALLFFGDSIVDAGNNNHLQTLVKCNFPPYGKNFEGGVPTGRFCNGNIPSDIIAKELGIKDTLPAYLDPAVLPQDLITGVTFASGGCGFDPLTPRLVSVLTLSDQLEHFKEYTGKLKAIIGEENTTFTLTNSLFVVVASSDDIANTYFTLRARALQYDVPAYTDLMANSASSFLQELYELGARRIGVFSAPPIGCVPSQRTLAGGAERECAENLNEAAKVFNSKLSKKLDSLASSLPSGRFVYLDIYNPLLDIIQNPRKYGFQVADKGCCGTGTLEAEVTQRLSNAKEAASKPAAFHNHEDLARKLQEEMEKNRKSSSGSKSDVSGRPTREVACPTCTVHLQVQVPSSGSETIECGVCQHPFLVGAD